MKSAVRTEITEKSLEIRTPQDEPRYTVEFLRYETINEDTSVMFVYQVFVYNADREPLYSSPEFLLHKDAEEDFERQVRNYKTLVMAETRPVDDMSVYADKIDYHKIDPDCCLNCVFCRRDNHHCQRRPDRCYHSPFGDLVCTNPENFVFFENLMNQDKCRGCDAWPSCGYLHRPDCGRNHNQWRHGELCDRGKPGSPGWELGTPDVDVLSKYPTTCPPQPFVPPLHFMDVRPRVQFNGVCKNHKRKVSSSQDCPPRPGF